MQRARFQGSAELPKKKRKEAIANRPYPSVAYELADKLKEFTDQDIRIAIPGIRREVEVLMHMTE